MPPAPSSRSIRYRSASAAPRRIAVSPITPVISDPWPASTRSDPSFQKGAARDQLGLTWHVFARRDTRIAPRPLALRSAREARTHGRPSPSVLSLIHISEPTRLLSISYA